MRSGSWHLEWFVTCIANPEMKAITESERALCQFLWQTVHQTLSHGVPCGMSPSDSAQHNGVAKSDHQTLSDGVPCGTSPLDLAQHDGIAELQISFSIPRLVCLLHGSVATGQPRDSP